jgi:hypothetical protein
VRTARRNPVEVALLFRIPALLPIKRLIDSDFIPFYGRIPFYARAVPREFEICASVAKFGMPVVFGIA